MKKKVMILDFDNTLVTTNAKIGVVNARGEKFELNSHEFSLYTPKSGDVFDFIQFRTTLINPKIIQKYNNLLNYAVSKREEFDIIILSARGDDVPIVDFYSNLGISHHIEIVALNTTDPKEKKQYIYRLIEEKGYQDILFFDDSKLNIDAVNELRSLYHPLEVRIHTHLVPEHHYKSPIKYATKNQLKKIFKQFIINPQTNRKIQIRNALKRDTNHPAHKLARRFILNSYKRKTRYANNSTGHLSKPSRQDNMERRENYSKDSS